MSDYNKVFKIPAIPLEIYTHLRKRSKSSAPIIEWKVREGDWVESFQTLALYKTEPVKIGYKLFKQKIVEAKIVAPFEGIITFISDAEFTEYPEYSSWSDFKDSLRNGEHGKKLEILFSIRKTDRKYIHQRKLSDTYWNILNYIHYTTNEEVPRKKISMDSNSIRFYLEMLSDTQMLED